MKLYIIRHGETDWNKQKRLQGQSDTMLNEYGIELAEITAKALKDVQFDYIFSSPLKRAYKTAEIIRGERNVPIVTDDRLKEIGFGINEGVRSELITKDFHFFFRRSGEVCSGRGRGNIRTALRPFKGLYRQGVGSAVR